MLKIIFTMAMLPILCLVALLWMSPLVQLTFVLFCLIYFVFIAPFIYRLWIIPNIEKRYESKLVFTAPIYQFDLIPTIHLEVAIYIFFAFFGYFFKNRYEAMHKINYEVKTAPKAEIIISFITVGSGVLGLLIPLINLLY